MKVEFQKISSEVLKDAYDRLVMRIKISKEKNKNNIFAFTGCGVDVDTASVARNVAIQTAYIGSKTLYIDACFVKNKNASMLVSPYTEGVLEYVLGQRVLGDILHSTNVHNLDFISCGNVENPTSAFASKEFEKFLEKVSEKYDYIFLDTPPINVTVGGAVLASKASGVVVVAEYNRTKKKQIVYVVEELENLGANIMGVIMHNVTAKFYKRFVGNFKINNNK